MKNRKEFDEFLNKLNENYKEQIIKILKGMIDIVSILIEELLQSQ